MPYKFEPSEALALYASIITGAEVHQMNLGTFTIEELTEYHLAMVSVAIVAIAKYNTEVCLELYHKCGNDLGDMIKEELTKKNLVMEQFEKREEITKEQREEEFLKNIKLGNKWRM